MIVEREKETRLLTQIFKESLLGRGQAVIIHGSVASGKTETLLHLSEHAKAHGGNHVHGTGTHAERNVPFGLLKQLLSSLLSDTEKQDSDQRHVLSPERLVPSPAHRMAEVPTAIASSLCRTLLGPASTAPLLITVDDIHHVDIESLDVLRQLSERLRDVRCFLVLTEAAHFPRANPRLHSDMLRHSHFRRLRLHPLSKQGVTQVATDRLGTEPAKRIAYDCHKVTGGNPLLVQALMEDCRSADNVTDLTRPVVGNEFEHAVLSCLERGGNTLLEVARATAVLTGSDNAPVIQALLTRMTGLSAKDVQWSFMALMNMSVLDSSNRFRHPAIRNTIIESLSHGCFSELSNAAARTLHASGAAERAIAEHLIAGDETATEQWSARVLLKAAEDALSEGHREFTAACIEPILHGRKEGVLAARARSTLARMEWQVNPALVESRFDELIQDHDAGHMDESDALMLLHYLLWFGKMDEAVGIMRTLMQSSANRTSLITAEIHLAYQTLTATYPGFRALLEAESARTGELAPSPRRPDHALGDMLRGEEIMSSAERAFQFLGNVRLDDYTLEAVKTALRTLVRNERLDQAQERCEQLLSEAARLGAQTWRAQLTAVKAEIAIRSGDLVTARESSEEALGLIPRHSWGLAIGAPLSTLLHSASSLGDQRAISLCLRAPVPLGLLQSRFGLSYLDARGGHYLRIGFPAAAAADFDLCGALMKKWNIDNPAFIAWRSGLSEAHLCMGNYETAERLAQEELERLPSDLPRTRGISLTAPVLSVQADGRGGVGAQAVDELWKNGDRYLLRSAVGHVEDPVGDKGGSSGEIPPLQSTSMVFAPAPERTLSSSEGALSLMNPPKKDLLATLTRSEKEVAKAAAMGRTNRDISQQLYITVSTVEQHLTRVYRKLGIKGRTSLRKWAKTDVFS